MICPVCGAREHTTNCPLGPLPVETELIDGERYMDVAGGVYAYSASYKKFFLGGKACISPSSSQTWRRMGPVAVYKSVPLPEPKGLGAVVRDSEGIKWVRNDYAAAPTKWRNGYGTIKLWGELVDERGPLTILSRGYDESV